jgi:hypothetical protein
LGSARYLWVPKSSTGKDNNGDNQVSKQSGRDKPFKGPGSFSIFENLIVQNYFTSVQSIFIYLSVENKKFTSRRQAVHRLQKNKSLIKKIKLTLSNNISVIDHHQVKC